MGKFASTIKVGPPRQGHWCGLCAFMESLDPESRAEVLTLLRDDRWGNKALADEFSQYVADIDSRTVDVHRKSRATRG